MMEPVADPEICPRGDPMTRKTYDMARWPSFLFLTSFKWGGGPGPPAPPGSATGSHVFPKYNHFKVQLEYKETDWHSNHLVNYILSVWVRTVKYYLDHLVCIQIEINFNKSRHTSRKAYAFVISYGTNLLLSEFL